MLALFCRDEGKVWENLELVESERAMFRFFRDREQAGPGMLVIATSAGTVSRECFFRLMRYYLRDYDANGADLFLSGGEIMKILGVHPGKTVGAAMARLREAEGAGEVASREEAQEFIKNLLTKEQPMR